VTGARERILAAVRAATGERDRRAVAAEAAALLQSPELIRPQLPDEDLSRVFEQKITLEKIGGTVQRIAALHELPAAVRGYLTDRNLPLSVAVQPAAELLVLDWRGIEHHTTIADDEMASVTLARWGIAETGSLVLHSGAEMPVLLQFLPLHAIVALRAESILAHMEDYPAAAARERPPRNVNIITGASGTTDIEGNYVRGAHGPGFLHVVIVEPDDKAAARRP
jgi:L-lactate dehydrogenase complex protein LldG